MTLFFRDRKDFLANTLDVNQINAIHSIES